MTTRSESDDAELARQRELGKKRQQRSRDRKKADKIKLDEDHAAKDARIADLEAKLAAEKDRADKAEAKLAAVPADIAEAQRQLRARFEAHNQDIEAHNQDIRELWAIIRRLGHSPDEINAAGAAIRSSYNVETSPRQPSGRKAAEIESNKDDEEPEPVSAERAGAEHRAARHAADERAAEERAEAEEEFRGHGNYPATTGENAGRSRLTPHDKRYLCQQLKQIEGESPETILAAAARIKEWRKYDNWTWEDVLA